MRAAAMTSPPRDSPELPWAPSCYDPGGFSFPEGPDGEPVTFLVAHLQALRKTGGHLHLTDFKRRVISCPLPDPVGLPDGRLIRRPPGWCAEPFESLALPSLGPKGSPAAEIPVLPLPRPFPQLHIHPSFTHPGTTPGGFGPQSPWAEGRVGLSMYIMDRTLHSRAWDLAATSHLGQTIPGSDLPYIVHVGRVVMLVMTAIARSTGVEDPDLAVLCALLHDVLEDTSVDYQQIVDLFGARVADGVAALTKNPDLAGKSERMEDSLRRIRAQPAEIWMVKMADRIANLRPPPSHWSTGKIAAYRQEAICIHQSLHLANTYLSTELRQAIQAYGAHGVRGTTNPERAP